MKVEISCADCKWINEHHYSEHCALGHTLQMLPVEEKCEHCVRSWPHSHLVQTPLIEEVHTTGYSITEKLNEIIRRVNSIR